MRRLVALALLAPSLALAQTQPKAPKYAPKTVINLDEDGVITSRTTRPLGEMIDSPKQAKHNSVIKFRDNFNREVLNSVKELP